MNVHDSMSMSTVLSKTFSIWNIPQFYQCVQRSSYKIIVSQHCDGSDYFRMSHLSLESKYFWWFELSILFCYCNFILELRDINALRNNIELLVNIRFCIMNKILKPFSLHKLPSFNISFAFLHTYRRIFNCCFVKMLVSNKLECVLSRMFL